MSHKKHHSSHAEGHGLASVLGDLRQAAAHSGEQATQFLDKASRTVETMIRDTRKGDGALPRRIGAELATHPRMAVGVSLFTLAGLIGLAALLQRRG